MKALRRTMQFGTARKPAASNSASLQPSNLEGTLSHQVAPPGPPPMIMNSFRRKESSTAFFSHWLTDPALGALLGHARLAASSRSSASSTASRASPVVEGPRSARCSQAASMAAASSAWEAVADMAGVRVELTG